MSKRIPLSQGKFALVSDEDYERVSQYKWSYDKGYAVRKVTYYVDGKRRTRTELLHRFILNAPKGFDVDHRNHNGLDCRRCNIRVATRSQNNANSRPRQGTTSQYKGVTWRSDTGRWRAEISIDGRMHRLGHFDNERDAALAYDHAALATWGEFANLNLPIVLATAP